MKELTTRLTDIQENLKLFIDSKGVLRTIGRFKRASNLRYSARYPALLPSNSHLTNLIIRECHFQAKHATLATTINLLRQEFWIPRIRQVVKLELRHCLPCKREYKQYKGKTKPPKLGDICLLDEGSHNLKYSWKIAKVEQQLHPDEDGVIRYVTVRTPNGKLSQRHAYRLYLLEAEPGLSVDCSNHSPSSSSTSFKTCCSKIQKRSSGSNTERNSINNSYFNVYY